MNRNTCANCGFVFCLLALVVGCNWPYDAQAGRVIYGQPILESFQAFVAGVSDGETITVVDSENVHHKVRLTAIDSPEKEQPYHLVAKINCSTLCYRKRVDVFQTGTDRDGRMLAFVIVDGVNLNAEMLRTGLAWHYDYYS